MRELNECRAEIFRRSEKRIRERRKNRTRLLTICVSFFICMTIGCTIDFSMMRSNGKSLPFEYDTYTGSTKEIYTQIEIRSDVNDVQMVRKITEADNIFAVYVYIDQIFWSDRSSADSAVGGYDLMDGCDGLVTQGTGSFEIFTITFSNKEDEVLFFTLNGNLLKLKNTGDIVILTDEELSELKELLRLDL